MFERITQDLRFGFRMLVNQPMVSVVAVLSLALGIGANTTIFTVVNAVFLTPMPLEHPERLARIHTVEWEFPDRLTGVSYLNYEDYRDNNTTFSALAAFSQTSTNLVLAGGEPQQISAQLVTANFFDVLGVAPLLGRAFIADEDNRPTPVVVLSHGIWTRRFGADPQIVGRQVSVAKRPFTVIGVGPPGFKGIDAIAEADLVWMPLAMREFVMTGTLGQYFELRRARFSQVIGRLENGVTVEQADAEIHTIGKRIQEEYPADNGGREGTVRLYSPINENQRDQYTRAATLMMAVVGVVLLIACANVANLLLAKAADREKEIALRIVLGAKRGRLVRQLLTESLLVSLLAGGVGVMVAFWARDLLWAYRPPSLGEHAIDLGLDVRVLGFTTGISLLTGLVFGVIPALQASNPNLRQSLREGGRRSVSRSNKVVLRSALVIAELALALVALVGAGLFIRSVRAAQSVDPGFESERLLLTRLNVGNAGYSRAEGAGFYRELLERVAAVPGVEAASYSSGRILGGSIMHTTYAEGIEIAGRPWSPRSGHRGDAQLLRDGGHSAGAGTAVQRARP